MKRTGTFILIILLFFCRALSAESEVKKEIAQKKTDGNFLMERDTRERFQEAYKGAYVTGVIDSAYYLAPEVMEKHYTSLGPEDIKTKVMEYYRNNPDKRNRTVVEVVLSGCK